MTRAAMIEHHPQLPRKYRFGCDDGVVTARLRTALEPLCISEVARQTGASRQSIHRYRDGHPASVGFLVRFCEATGTSAEWLLLGRGPQRRCEAVAEHLAHATAGELCAALATRIEPPAPRPLVFRPRLVSDSA